MLYHGFLYSMSLKKLGGKTLKMTKWEGTRKMEHRRSKSKVNSGLVWGMKPWEQHNSSHCHWPKLLFVMILHQN